jgi:hypothetical protein
MVDAQTDKQTITGVKSGDLGGQLHKKRSVAVARPIQPSLGHPVTQYSGIKAAGHHSRNSHTGRLAGESMTGTELSN